MKKITDIAHDFLLEAINEKSIAVDFTAGQGYDTLFLANHAQKVIAYDIQLEAVTQTKALLEEHHCQNAVLLHKSHERVNEDVECFDIGIFNLGYLPHGNENITTDGDTVIRTLKKALNLLAGKGRIVLVLYPGFEAGKKESEQVEAFCAQLPSKQYDTAKLIMTNRKNCPYMMIIDKH